MKLATRLLETLRQLNEKLIIINKGKKNSQIVFLAGGASSGKGFAAANLIRLESYKTFNVDDLKTRLVKIAKLKGINPELAGIDFKNPDDVSFLHGFVKERGLDSKAIDTFLRSASKSKELPNILFDVTFDDIKKFESLKPKLLEVGYRPEDIHVIWVLTDFATAVKSNKERPRVVPEDIQLKTHIGAAKTLTDLVLKKNPVKGLDGEIHVILNNREETVPFVDSKGKKVSLSVPRTTAKQLGLKLKAGKSDITKTDAGDVLRLKSFAALKIKSSGKPVKLGDVTDKLKGWVLDNVPDKAKQFVG